VPESPFPHLVLNKVPHGTFYNGRRTFGIMVLQDKFDADAGPSHLRALIAIRAWDSVW
jgi:hypothetical protein